MSNLIPFTERTRQFWSWFADNEETLADMVTKPNREDGGESVVEFINQGTALLGGGLHFNMGGDFEFTFAVSGKSERFFLLPYVTANLPEPFRKKWKFFPSMQSVDGHDFGFQMYDVGVSNNDVMVFASPDEEGKRANLRFFAEAWRALEEPSRYNAFYISMEITIGESLAHSCIGEVTWIDECEKDMFPLTQLEQWMLQNLCENGEVPDPAQSYFVYQLGIEDNQLPRQDVFIGSGCFAPIINDYYDRKNDCYDAFAAHGATPVFLYWSYENSDTAFDERNVLMDKIEEEVLGARGFGQEIGLVFGGAMGQRCVYIDLLLYDMPLFLEKARAFLADSPYQIFCQEFRQDGEEYLLTQKNK